MNIRRLPSLSERIALIQLVGGSGPWEVARLEEWALLSCGSPKIIRAVDRIGERIYGPHWLVFITGQPIGAQS